MKEALAAWAQIAPGLGCAPCAYKAKLIWQKDEPARSHVVIRLKGPRPLILKQVFKAPEDAGLAQSVAAQQDAFDRLRDHADAHAPEVLFTNDDGTLVVMAEATGKTLNDHLTAGRKPVDMLRRTGAWLAAFHGSSPPEVRTYQPKFMVAHANRMADAVTEGRLSVALPDLFVHCCRGLGSYAEKAEGQQTLSTIKHGDFNMRNVLLGPDGATGLDFKPVSTAPVGFDIARILMDFAELFQRSRDLSPGAVLSEETLAAFFSGYDLVGLDDPSVRFVPYVQLLNDWRLIPPDPQRRSWRQTARMTAIERLARNGFET